MKSFRASSLSLVLLLASGVIAADEVKITPDVLQPKKTQNTKRNYPPEMAGCTTEVYKTVGDAKLNIHIFHPPTHEGNESRAAIVFFFGGGWRGGTPQQFEQHCRYLASRGLVAMTADYRVSSRHRTQAKECVMDGKSAIRWIRKNAVRLGIDPDRITAAGGSAGGHVAACTGTIQGFEQPGEDRNVSSRPNALALFNPAVLLAKTDAYPAIDDKKIAALTPRMGVEPAEISPYHQLEKGLPPTIIFHGKGDTTVPYQTVELFADKALGNSDEVVLAGYEGQPHGFFNFGRSDNTFYMATMKQLDNFLVNHGLMEGPSPATIKIIDAPP